MRYVAEKNGAVLDTKTGMREYCASYETAQRLAYYQNQQIKQAA